VREVVVARRPSETTVVATAISSRPFGEVFDWVGHFQ
jgi:hypothetical protein